MPVTQTRTGPDRRRANQHVEGDAMRGDESAERRETHAVRSRDVLTVIAELEDELVRGEEMRLAAERRASETAERARVTKRQNHKLLARMTAMQERVSASERQLEAARGDQAATVQSATQRVRAENDRLRKEIESVRERVGGLHKAEAERDKLRKIGAKLRDSLVIRDRQLKAAEADHARLEAESREAEGASQGSLAKATIERDRIAARLKKVCEALKSAKAAQKTAAAKAEARDKRAAALAAELEETSALKRGSEHKLSGAIMTCGRLKKELVGVRKSLSQAAAEQSQAQRRVRELESRVEKTQAERTELLATLNHTDAALCELKVERDRLNEHARQAQDALDATVAAKTDAEDKLRKQTHRLTESVKDVQEINATLRRSEADLNEIASQRDQLRERLKAARGELADAKAARQDAESSATAKGERLKQLQSIVDDALALKITLMKDENEAFGGRVRALERDNASLSKQNAKRKAELRSLRDGQRVAEANLKQMRTVVADLNSVLTTTGSQFAKTVETEKETSGTSPIVSPPGVSAR